MGVPLPREETPGEEQTEAERDGAGQLGSESVHLRAPLVFVMGVRLGIHLSGGSNSGGMHFKAVRG